MQGIVLVESALIGALASLLGIVSGLVLSLVLTYVINKAFFGWTIQFSVPWLVVLSTPVWILLAASGRRLAAGVARGPRGDRHRNPGRVNGVNFPNNVHLLKIPASFAFSRSQRPRS